MRQQSRQMKRGKLRSRVVKLRPRSVIAFSVVDHLASLFARSPATVGGRLVRPFCSRTASLPARRAASPTSPSSLGDLPQHADAPAPLACLGASLAASPATRALSPTKIRDCKLFVQFACFPTRRIMPFVYFSLYQPSLPRYDNINRAAGRLAARACLC